MQCTKSPTLLVELWGHSVQSSIELPLVKLAPTVDYIMNKGGIF